MSSTLLLVANHTGTKTLQKSKKIFLVASHKIVYNFSSTKSWITSSSENKLKTNFCDDLC